MKDGQTANAEVPRRDFDHPWCQRNRSRTEILRWLCPRTKPVIHEHSARTLCSRSILCKWVLSLEYSHILYSKGISHQLFKFKLSFLFHPSWLSLPFFHFHPFSIFFLACLPWVHRIWETTASSTRWCPPSHKLVYNPINYSYKYHKP